MKKLSCLMFCAVLFSVSCNPNSMRHCDPGYVSNLTLMTAQRNGVLWNTRNIKGILSPVDSLTINATSAQLQTYPLIKLDSLAVKIAYTNTGTYNLTGNQVFYATYNQNGALNSYKLDNTFNNEINITSYQALNNPNMSNANAVEIKGTFNIKFIDPNNPAGISFSNGNFYFIVNQQ